MGISNTITFIIQENHQGTKSVEEVFVEILLSEIAKKRHENDLKQLKSERQSAIIGSMAIPISVVPKRF